MKKTVLVLLITIILTVSPAVIIPVGASSDKLETIEVDINSVPIAINNSNADIVTILYSGKLYVPIRQICYLFNSEIKFDGNNNCIDIVSADKPDTISQLDELKKMKSRQQIEVEINPYIIKLDGINTHINSLLYMNTTFIPVRYIAEVFNKKIDWDSEKNSAVISDMPDVMIGKVNGQSITAQEFDYYYNREINKIQNQGYQISEQEINSLKEQIFNYLVTEKILSQKSIENNIVLNDSDLVSINNAIDQLLHQYQGIENFRKTLINYDTYFQQVVVEYKQNYLFNKLYKELTKDIQVSDDEVKKYYEENMAVYTMPEMVKAKHILFLTQDESGKPLDLEKKEEIKKKAEDVLSQIKSAEDFDWLMKEFSQDPALESYPKGYTFQKGEMVKEFEDAAFAMKAGEISDLVETVYGYHIIKLEEKIPQRVLDYEEVKEEIRKDIYIEKKNKHFSELINKWKSESKIENKMK